MTDRYVTRWPRTQTQWRQSILIGLAGITLASSDCVMARTVRVVIDERVPADDPANSGKSGAYELIRGRLFGELDPAEKSNRIIQDIAIASRNRRGKVEYISTFTLLHPVDPAKDAGVLIDAMPNRGNRGVASWRGGRGLIDPLYYEQGWSVLWIGWQGDLAERPSATQSAAGLRQESLLAPVVKSVGGKPVTGRYLVRVPTDAGNGPSGTIMRLDQGGAGALVYPPASFSTQRAVFTGGAPEDASGKPTGPRYTIAPADWQWWDCKADAVPTVTSATADLCVKRIKGSFNPQESYTLVFDARDPRVMGVGFAAVRDATSFFRYAAKDSAGAANPLAGRIKSVIGQGVSQVGNFVKTFILLGFNADEQGHKVWDGAQAHIGARLAPVNFRFSTPGSGSSLYMPGSEGTVWWSKSTAPSHPGAARSMLDRCSATNTCPRVFETFGGSELWDLRMSSNLVTSDLKADIALPAKVRRYYFPGTSHGGGQGGFKLEQPTGICTMPLNPNPQFEQTRALTLAMVEWLRSGKEPPASAYPSLSGRTLIRADELRFPEKTGIPSPVGLAIPTIVYDYGPAFRYADESGVITREPPAIRATIPALVANIDADGNETAGVPSVPAMAPLGTYLSWNTYKGGVYKDQICSFNGGFVPFARTAAERVASGDPRLSIEERYHTRTGFIAAVRAAVAKAKARGFLLPQDGERFVQQATAETEKGSLSFLQP